MKTWTLGLLMTLTSLSFAAQAEIYQCKSYHQEGTAAIVSIEARSEREAELKIANLTLTLNREGNLVQAQTMKNCNDSNASTKADCFPILDVRCTNSGVL